MVQRSTRPVSLGRIVTAGDKGFGQYVRQAKYKAELVGYPVTVFDLGGLGYGQPLEADPGDLKKDSFIPCCFKPRAIRQALSGSTETHLVWLDADAFMQGPIDEVFTDDYDIGVTRRDEAEIKLYRNNPKVGTINSGVIFFRRTAKLPDFLDEWEVRARHFNLEQRGLNEMVAESWGDLRYKYFPSRLYNNYYFDGRDVERPKILHYKGSRRHRLS